jgi:hypothetical protein
VATKHVLFLSTPYTTCLRLLGAMRLGVRVVFPAKFAPAFGLAPEDLRSTILDAVLLILDFSQE